MHQRFTRQRHRRQLAASVLPQRIEEGCSAHYPIAPDGPNGFIIDYESARNPSFHGFGGNSGRSAPPNHVQWALSHSGKE
jgi:hypothetical protein